MTQEKYNIAALSQHSLQQIRSLEKELREETGEEVILIAYEEEHNHLNS